MYVQLSEKVLDVTVDHIRIPAAGRFVPALIDYPKKRRKDAPGVL